jgi:hypothetical protein
MVNGMAHPKKRLVSIYDGKKILSPAAKEIGTILIMSNSEFILNYSVA